MVGPRLGAEHSVQGSPVMQTGIKSQRLQTKNCLNSWPFVRCIKVNKSTINARLDQSIIIFPYLCESQMASRWIRQGTIYDNLLGCFFFCVGNSCFLLRLLVFVFFATVPGRCFLQQWWAYFATVLAGRRVFFATVGHVFCIGKVCFLRRWRFLRRYIIHFFATVGADPPPCFSLCNPCFLR